MSNPKWELHTCPDCNGSGRSIKRALRDGRPLFVSEECYETCQLCGGHGKVQIRKISNEIIDRTPKYNIPYYQAVDPRKLNTTL